MRKTWLIVAGSVLIAVALGALVLMATRPSPSLHVTASFLNYTNDVSGVRWALFAITNSGNVSIMRRDLCDIEYQRGSERPSSVSLRAIVTLAPGQSEIVRVWKPTNRGPWRANFDGLADGWRLRLNVWCGRRPGGLLDRFVPNRLRQVPGQKIRSDWIDP